MGQHCTLDVNSLSGLASMLSEGLHHKEDYSKQNYNYKKPYTQDLTSAIMQTPPLY